MAQQIIEKIKDAGVIGAGGAGFPSHVKLSGQAEVVVVNGAECEPLLRVDQQLMVVEAEKMVQGLEYALEVTEAKEGVIALKAKYKEAIATLEKVIAGKNHIRIYILDDCYPAGDEHVTLYESTGRLVPQGGIPLKAGAVVTNVETLINICNAQEGIPVTDTYLTMCGAVPNPITVKVPVGITVREAFALAGVKSFSGYGIIDGGPMMGAILEDVDQPVVKAAKGYILLPEDHHLIANRRLSMETISHRAQTACIQCRFCTDLCPRYLLGHEIEPHKIMRALKYSQFNEETIRMAFTCSECGMCEQYSCIAGLSPRTVNANLKRMLSSNGIKPLDPPDPQVVHPNRRDRKIPTKRLISRLNLKLYDVKAPLTDETFTFDKVTLPLRQHIGAPSVPVVTAGQSVTKGDLVAKIPEDALGANIHASISGVIAEVSDSAIVITRGGVQS